jgi:hypothetical protein
MVIIIIMLNRHGFAQRADRPGLGKGMMDGMGYGSHPTDKPRSTVRGIPRTKSPPDLGRQEQRSPFFVSFVGTKYVLY